MLPPVRRHLAALALVLLVPALGACKYQTDQVYQPGVGSNNRAGVVDVLGAVVVSTTNGQGTFVSSLVNKGTKDADTLSSVGGDGIQGQISSPVEVKPDSLVNLASTGAIGLTGDGIKTGGFVRLTLSFSSGQKTTMNVPVVPPGQEFATVKEATPSGSASPSPSPSPAG